MNVRSDRRYLPSRNYEIYSRYSGFGLGFQADDYPWFRYVIYASNIVFVVVGVVTLAVGAWLRTDSRFRDFLSERYRNVVSEAFWQAPTLYAFSYILIILGMSLTVVALIGCCGAILRTNLLLIIYIVLTFALLIAIISSMIYLNFKKDGIGVEVSDALTYMVQHYYQGAGIVQESLDRLQQAFRCCGNSGCGDFRIFRQDPPRSCDIRCDGCHHRIMISLQVGFSIAIAVYSLVIFSQVIAIVSSVMLLSKRRNEVEERYRHYNVGRKYRNFVL